MVGMPVQANFIDMDPAASKPQTIIAWTNLRPQHNV